MMGVSSLRLSFLLRCEIHCLKASVTDPNAGTSHTYYDSFGRAVLTRDALGRGTATSFDALSRPVRTLTGITVPAPASVPGPQAITAWIAGLSTATEGETETLHTYDTAPGYGLGKAATVTFREFERDGSGAITATRQVVETYAYDSLGRSVSASTTLSGQVAFDGTYTVSTSYDALGRVSTVTDAGGHTRASVYNARGFLAEVHEGFQGGSLLWRGMSYDASGKLLLEHHGNGIGTQNRYHPTRGFLESSRTLRWTTNAAIQEYEMQLDDLGNVLWRREQRFEGTSPVTRTETFGYDRLNRLTYSAVTGQALQSFTFAANGNIASKSGIGTYSYAERGHGPHAVTSVTVGTEVQRSYSYDAKGRMTTEHAGTNLALTPLREIAYTSFDQPRFIQHWGAAALSSDVGALDDGVTPWDQVCTLRFYFGPGMQRLIQVKHKGALVTKVLSLGGYEIRETTSGSLTGTMIEREERSSFGNGTRVKRWTVTSPTVPVITYEFAAKDHLGSDTATFDSSSQLQAQRGHLKAGEVQKSERQSYDAWGARRDGETWAPAAGHLGQAVPGQPSEERLGSNVPRGYTGHEMLDDVGLIHMNGRLYDAALGRMCAADRDVQAPDLAQNYNRYSYVLNNPMNATDPSGHNWFKKIIGIIIAVIIAVIIAIVAVWALGLLLQAMGSVVGLAAGTSSFIFSTSATFGTIAGLNGGIVVAAAVGATWSAVNTTIAGGSFSQVLKSAVTGAINGAVGAIVGGGLHGVGEWAGSLSGGSKILATAAHYSAHGAAGGAMSEANGGSFRDGFIGGLIGAGISGITSRIPGLSGLYDEASATYRSVASIAARTAIAAVSGGIGSVALGGKFADGAYSGAFFHLFNNESLLQNLQDARSRRVFSSHDGGAFIASDHPWL